jgi:hypothetical protein
MLSCTDFGAQWGQVLGKTDHFEEVDYVIAKVGQETSPYRKGSQVSSAIGLWLTV